MQVVSLDWKWLFIYPEQGIASVNELVVPAGMPVHFSLTSASVMNMFFVPQLGSMITTMNGMVTQLNLQADHPGELLRPVGAIQRRRLFRHAFHGARGAAAEFAQWVDDRAASRLGTRPERLRRARAAEPERAPFTYRAVEPRLFDAIVTQQIPPGPGPQAGRGGPRFARRERS